MVSIDQMQQGTRPSFQQLVGDHSRRLFRLACRMTGNEQDAEEVVQETLLRAYQRLHTFDGRSAISTWLYRIAANCCLDLVRNRKKRGGEKSLEEETFLDPRAITARIDPERTAMSRQIKERVELALGRLSPLERAAFVLRHFQ